MESIQRFWEEKMMKEFSASASIEASPEAIWAILTDASGYPEWVPGMVCVEGTIAPGRKSRSIRI